MLTRDEAVSLVWQEVLWLIGTAVLCTLETCYIVMTVPDRTDTSCLLQQANVSQIKVSKDFRIPLSSSS
jgi:hypothetical protein